MVALNFKQVASIVSSGMLEMSANDYEATWTDAYDKSYLCIFITLGLNNASCLGDKILVA